MVGCSAELGLDGSMKLRRFVADAICQLLAAGNYQEKRPPLYSGSFRPNWQRFEDLTRGQTDGG